MAYQDSKNNKVISNGAIPDLFELKAHVCLAGQLHLLCGTLAWRSTVLRSQTRTTSGDKSASYNVGALDLRPQCHASLGHKGSEQQL